jgi:uncharacterized RDD family membrane protein YckC
MEVNPYQPPSAKLIDESVTTEVELAGRGQRLGAAILDTFVGVAVAIPLMFALGTFGYIRRGQQLPWPLHVASAVLGFLGFVLLHGYYLKISGQTIGKRIVGIRIADLDNSIPKFAKVLGLRYLPIQIATLIPVAGALYALVDALFIFFPDRRCLHDLIAGTKVVKVK